MTTATATAPVTTYQKPQFLTNGQSSALLILVGIRLDKVSTTFEQEAKDLLAGKQIYPQSIGWFTREAIDAKAVIMEANLADEAQIEAEKIMEEYNL